MVEEYFKSEQSNSILLISIGLVVMAVGAGIFIFYRSKFSLGFLISASVLAIIQLVAGSFIYFRSPVDMERVNGFYEDRPELISTEEIPRMEEVMSGFEFYRWTEIVLFLSGIFLLAVGRRKKWLMGVGLGILLQSSMMFLFDFHAERRAEIYLKHLIESLN